MSRRQFLKASAALGAATLATGIRGTRAQQQASSTAPDRPIRIVMGGYAPASTGFSRALNRIGERLGARFGSDVEVRYVYNILDLGYQAADILWLVEQGVLTLGYQSSSYFGDRVPGIGVADLPFLFTDTDAARAAIDGSLGRALSGEIEANMGYRILGFFENGFRHISNRLRPVQGPEDLRGMRIRVLPSREHVRTFELLGAEPQIMDLSVALERIKAGTIDAQENPFANTVTYGVHEFHKFHTVTSHFYLSRPIFVHRGSFDAWPLELRTEMRAAVAESVEFQRALHLEEEVAAASAIRESGGEILELDPEHKQKFVAAVAPIYSEARGRYSPELLSAVNL